MATKIDQKAYLQKYLGGPEKKKKKKKVAKGKGFKIIDDDIDLTKLRPLDGDEIDLLDQGEDAPQIAGIIDERPEELKKLEQFKTSSKWRVINQDDGFNSKLQIEEIKRDVKEQEKENELIFGKMYSDSEDDGKKGSDASSLRKSKVNSSEKQTNMSDSDFSPPRRGDNRGSPPKNRNYDSDVSPPRKNNIQSGKTKPRTKPSRWGEREHRSPSSDLSPPRKSRKEESSKERSYNSSKKVGSIEKQNRKHRMHKKSESSSSDEAQRRNTYKIDKRKKKEKSRRETSDLDLSPPRKNKRDDSPSLAKSRRSPEKRHDRTKQDSDSDLSPPRRNINSRDNSSQKTSRNRIFDANNSRDEEGKRNVGTIRRENRDIDRRDRKRGSDSPPPSNKKMARTLEGKMAGLQDATQLRVENEEFRKREDDAFRSLADDLSGRNAQAVSRKSKRETSEERRKLKEKADRQKELDDKYKKWGKGIKQIAAQEARVQEFIHESSKPLARYRNDRDLEAKLKDEERAGDPMLQYIRDKKRERGELEPEKPMYKGSFPPNRFNIHPGYRWDGVDRSNGYEKKYFEQQSKRKAQAEEAYKWSTEDL